MKLFTILEQTSIFNIPNVRSHIRQIEIALIKLSKNEMYSTIKSNIALKTSLQDIRYYSYKTSQRKKIIFPPWSSALNTIYSTYIHYISYHLH